MILRLVIKRDGSACCLCLGFVVMYLQVSVLEQLAKLLESSGVDRRADEDLASMRDEARRKLAEVNEVIFLIPLSPL